MRTIRVFQYVETLDAFLITEEFSAIADHLGLTEWSAVVWIGRLFMLDNDYGEHWFDNWDEREALETRAQDLGIDTFDLMIIVPERLADKSDGPCNTPEIRKAFWTDVLKSLELSYDLLFEKARHDNTARKDDTAYMERFPDEYIPDLEDRISAISERLTHSQ